MILKLPTEKGQKRSYPDKQERKQTADVHGMYMSHHAV